MTTIVDSNLPVARPSWDHSRLESRIVHLGCGAFHRAHQALYTHHLLESTDSDWGICEVNLMPGNDRSHLYTSPSPRDGATSRMPSSA